MADGRAPFPPPLLSSLPEPVQLQIVVLVPLLFGTICGFLLGETEAGWWVANVIAATGGFAGGFEHDSPASGLRRGLLAGAMFGAGVVIGDAISGDAARAEVPDPLPLLIVITSLIGGLLASLGARARRRYERRRSAPASS